MAAKQILFLYKNKADISNDSLTVTASEGNDYASRALNGNNVTAWTTTGSTDASLTTFTVDFGEPRRIDTLILAKHNFKNYTIQYYDGVSWLDFSTAIAETVYASENSYYEFTLVHAYKIKITINGTQIADSDKYLYQFIASEKIGRLNGWPIITQPKLDRNAQNSKMLSGKMQITQNLGGWSFDLQVKIWSDEDDLAVVQNLYNSPEGFLVYLCGGNPDQFKATGVEPYRGQDILLMRTLGVFSPQLYRGLYASGFEIKMSVVEVTS